MGNYKFRLSDIMPNAWFYKLKDMGKSRNQNSLHQKKKKKKKHTTNTTTTTAFPSSSSSSSYASSYSSSMTTTTLSYKPNQTHHQHQHQHRPRKSYYFTRELNSHTNDTKSPDHHFPEQPRKSPKQRKKRPTTKTSSHNKLLMRNNCKTTIDSVWTTTTTTTTTKPESSPEFSPTPSSPEREFPSEDPEFRCDRILTTATTMQQQACGCRENFEENDIVIDVDKASLSRKPDSSNEFDSFSVVELPPIITKTTTKLNRKKLESPISQRNSPVRKLSSSSNSPGIRLRMNSPRISSKKVFSHGRKSFSEKRRSLSESFAIVKSSFDPQRDFRESMVEMIVENNIRASKDLEDLLACYLSLNSDEYHDLIIKVFKQIWFDLTDISSK